MDFSKLTDDDILAIANPLMDKLMQASTDRDHAKHIEDFTARLKNIVTKENLETQWANSTDGEFSRRKFLTIIRKKSHIFVLWKQWMSASEDEFLAEIVIVYRDGRYLVDHTWVR
jgi:hypothetical protein